GRPRAEVGFGFSRLQCANVSLMAIHTNVIRQPRWKLRWIDDRPVRCIGYGVARLPFEHVQVPGPMTVFTADRKLEHWRVPVESLSAHDRLCSAGVASNAVSRYRKTEAKIPHREVGGEIPCFLRCIVRNWGLKQVVAPADHRC